MRRESPLSATGEDTGRSRQKKPHRESTRDGTDLSAAMALSTRTHRSITSKFHQMTLARAIADNSLTKEQMCDQRPRIERVVIRFANFACWPTVACITSTPAKQ